MNEYYLSNGIKVFYYPNLHTHSISLGLYIKTGSVYENNSNNGITHLLEHLHFRRLGKMSQDELYTKMESIGSSLRAITYKDFLRFYMKIRPKFIKESISFFQEIINTVKWEEDEFEKEKQVVLCQIEDKNSYINIDSLVSETVWKDSPLSLSIMGTRKNLINMQLDDIVEYKKCYFRPDNLAFFITGCISNDEIHLINSELSSIIFESSLKKCLSREIKIKPNQRSPDINFVNINGNYLDVNISFDVDYKLVSREEIILLNCMLGEGVGSKLQRKIREENALTSNIYSSVEDYKDVAVIHIKYSIKKNCLYESLRLIVEVLNSMKIDISKSDFETTIPFYTENLWYILDDTDELNFKLGYEYFILEMPEYSIDKKISLYKSISGSDLMKAANIVFKSTNASVVVLGSTSKLTKKEIKSIFQMLCT